MSPSPSAAFRVFVLTFAGMLLAACSASSPTAGGSPARDADPALTVRAGGDYPPPDADGKVRLTEDEWRARLTPEQFRVLRSAGTEAPFCEGYLKLRTEPGTYVCAGCGLGLFAAATQFDSGTGWPSFMRPVAPGRVTDHIDRSHGMTRVENRCARCDGHLGHVFPDGPGPEGLRYCINSAALRFVPDAATDAGAAEKSP